VIGEKEVKTRDDVVNPTYDQPGSGELPKGLRCSGYLVKSTEWRWRVSRCPGKLSNPIRHSIKRKRAIQ